ncbi:ASCH domain-containing protein [Xenorhabdus bovienii]|nr:ASCH domain-containing protein [Xenorhabdus bovienii]MDE9563818.1 ASCH domain-containing protein [Xenorhabdus bovienii]
MTFLTFFYNYLLSEEITNNRSMEGILKKTIKDGNERSVCVVRTTVIRLVRFTDVTEEMARKEGEGDLSLSYRRKEPQNFFERESSYSENMELVFEEFELIETE